MKQAVIMKVSEMQDIQVDNVKKVLAISFVPAKIVAVSAETDFM